MSGSCGCGSMWALQCVFVAVSGSCSAYSLQGFAGFRLFWVCSLPGVGFEGVSGFVNVGVA